jgi:16S rRNA (guanine966-N2)-methyltransferase
VDLVLADPPYDVDAAEVGSMLAALAAGGWVAPGSVVVVERRTSSEPLTWPEGWSAWPERRYGDTRLEMAQLGG